jgi:hypothetical protein
MKLVGVVALLGCMFTSSVGAYGKDRVVAGARDNNDSHLSRLHLPFYRIISFPLLAFGPSQHSQRADLLQLPSCRARLRAAIQIVVGIVVVVVVGIVVGIDVGSNSDR